MQSPFSNRGRVFSSNLHHSSNSFPASTMESSPVLPWPGQLTAQLGPSALLLFSLSYLLCTLAFLNWNQDVVHFTPECGLHIVRTACAKPASGHAVSRWFVNVYHASWPRRMGQRQERTAHRVLCTKSRINTLGKCAETARWGRNGFSEIYQNLRALSNLC